MAAKLPSAEAVVAAGGYERDTDAGEDINLSELLFGPNASGPPSEVVASFAYNTFLLNGWVKQSSPACAAASVAGAYNALQRIGRHDPKALQQADLVEVLKGILRTRLTTHAAKFHADVGCSVEPLAQALQAHLAAQDKSLGMKWPRQARAKTIKEVLRTILQDIATEGNADNPLFPLANAVAYEAGGEENQAAVGNSEEEDDDTDAKVDGVEIFLPGQAADRPVPAATVDQDGAPLPHRISPLWRKSFLQYCNNLGGLEKLERERPSTGFFGTWGILGAVRRLADQYQVRLSNPHSR
ncbi:uncharacterized protein MONBRDRAFT_25737 [Monosiga brevicollis MX1]|uniref:Uncharacterized protein n=1 Tax=Monosiga brevicollis TaxID=81824 RepID=A9V0A1_MONBE|nr:uncharacterized protein MONBRDRAFT_25737 [Monosiga brevicollis MX1]EDQ89122.1 predicted protein [Monosiga brevicollis MX1]|eukprot:XP_001746227.1 hypothetical protein [Monosiga brevicollis MX1]